MRLLPEGDDNIKLFVSFPPGDVNYVDDLINSLVGRWDIETVGSKMLPYRIRAVQVYDEPLGGFMNVYVDRNGQPYKDSYIEHGSTLVIDIGGKVSSVLRVLEGERVQYGTARSIDQGIQDVIYSFTDNLKSNHPEVHGIRSFNEGLVREALSTGLYQFKGREINVTDDVIRAANLVMNRRIQSYVQDFKGGADDRGSPQGRATPFPDPTYD